MGRYEIWIANHHLFRRSARDLLVNKPSSVTRRTSSCRLPLLEASAVEQAEVPLSPMINLSWTLPHGSHCIIRAFQRSDEVSVWDPPSYSVFAAA